jgi:hypothetical protein
MGYFIYSAEQPGVGIVAAFSKTQADARPGRVADRVAEFTATCTPCTLAGMLTNQTGSELLADFIDYSSDLVPDGVPVKKRFAITAGLTQTELSHLLAGRRTPNLRQAVNISDATAGAVPVRSWLQDDRL